MTNTEDTFETLAAEYGVYSKDGMDYVIVQLPYISSMDTYSAYGQDRDGNNVKLTWDISNLDTTDESDACNWTVFDVDSL